MNVKRKNKREKEFKEFMKRYNIAINSEALDLTELPIEDILKHLCEDK